MPASAEPASRPPTDERGAALALLPVAATLDYYALPEWLQAQPLVQFAPQIIGYLACALWASHNTRIALHVGLQASNVRDGLKLGTVIGLLLGSLNSYVILNLLPSYGHDITFLKETPHAQVPAIIMVPWLIAGIALFVEFNFRGFVLGRLAALESPLWSTPVLRRISPSALATSALVFAFDPFMVATFRHLHWIAVWDGVVWGIVWLRTRNLYATIVAHAVEVIIMYSAVRSILLP
jgi:membrane protease YdiL (CAAX protease family)